MSGLIAKLIFNKILRENPSNNQGRNDPYFETVPTTRLSLSGQPKTKKQRKALPPGLTREEEQILVKVKRRAYRLDMAFGSCCGMKIGWSSLIAIIPGFGDVIDMLLALMVIRTASEANLPSAVRLHMFFNVTLDFVIGLVPFLGDLMDIAFKANTRNAILFENHLREVGAERTKKQGLPPQTDPSLGEVYDEQIASQQPVAQPPPSYSWFGHRKEHDVEAQRPSGAPLRGGERMHGGRHDRRVSKQKSPKTGGGSRREALRGQRSRQESGVRNGW